MIAPTTYQKLVDELKRIHLLGSTMGLLGWDEQVMLPAGSARFRAEQKAALADLIHREFTREEIGQWLSDLESQEDSLDEGQRAVVREARRDYDRSVKLPSEFVQRKSLSESEAYHAWTEARKQSDFAQFAPHIERNIALAKEQAAFFGRENDALSYWVDIFNPGIDVPTIERLFGQLRTELIPLVKEITESPIKADPARLQGFPEATQEAFLREVVTSFGFDFQRGRIDRSVHPFCGGNPSDVRMTTRYNENLPIESLSGAMHETGHALYEQGLLSEHLGTALGENCGMAVHESQSRLWENQVGRSRAFWSYWEPRYRQAFPTQLEGISPEELYLMVNHVAITPIRVDADEVTYNLHIMLRFELEKRFFSGDLAVADLPAAWNELSTQILGYTPKEDREGCLQDVHWSSVAFGYFPSYCLGNLIAAQLWYALCDDIPDVEAQIAKGEHAAILNWLREKVHHQGLRYHTPELVQRASGQPIQTDSLIRYLRERYLPLYTPAS